MGIEDPVWGRIVIVLGFIGILLGFLYFSKLKGKKIFSQLSSNEFLKLDETISISNISKASLISVGSNKFLIGSNGKLISNEFTNELLPVIDSLELGLSASVDAEKAGDIYKGMELTLEKFTTVIEKFGIEKINPKGEKFDPECHQAIKKIESSEVKEEIVSEEYAKGYKLNGRLLRASMVSVSVPNT